MVVDKFLKYVKIDTESDASSTSFPSTEKQKDLARVLVEELKQMGVNNAYMDAYGYVYGSIESNVAHSTKTVGFIAHMDTSPDYSGKNVNPRIIENYDGKDIELSSTVTTKVSDFPELTDLKGKTLIVTDGTTLLGSDDKAGIAEIMEAVEYYMNNPEVKHGAIKIAFTPDEEVGKGADHFNVKEFNADFAFTVDGGEVSNIAYENFNAAQADVKINGFSIHPGSAKNKLKNAILIAMEFNSMLPAEKRPEYTEGFEGFNHVMNMEGNIDHAEMIYIIRNHDADLFAKQKEQFKQIESYLNHKYGKDTVVCDISETYRNMKEVFHDKQYIIDIAKLAIEKAGLTPVSEAIRGGTDGARLTYEGLPCPNIGTGGRNVHGRHELCIKEEMELSVEIIKNIVSEIVRG